MKPHSLFTLALLAAVALGAEAAPETGAAPALRFYTALAMTRAQQNTSVPADSGLYYRTGDNAWTHFGPRVLGVGSIAVDPRDPRVVMVASADGVVRSTDGGEHWRKVTGWRVADVRSFAIDARRPDRIYAATAWGPLRSTDAGVTWDLVKEGLPRLYCQTVLVAPDSRVLLGTETGLFALDDGAPSWRRLAFPEVPVLRLAQTAADAKVLLAGTQGRGAWVSRDGAKTWTQASGVPATANIYAVAVDPTDAQRLVAGGWGVGVRLSDDGGATWRDVTRGLPTANVFTVACDPARRGRIWASVFEEGVFYTDDAGASWRLDGLEGAYVFDFVFAPAAH